jgi:RNA polymerase sigma-70 factor (ECF subfamily)
VELLERFAAGDPDAFETLFREHQSAVYGWILRIVRDRGIADDLTVETFWRFYKARARYDTSIANPAALLRRIATNAALDHLRRNRREVPLPDDLPLPPASLAPGQQNELRGQLAAAVKALSPRLRVAVQLALVEEEPYEEIAAALGISPNAVKVRVFRGIRILRKTLKEAGAHP